MTASNASQKPRRFAWSNGNLLHKKARRYSTTTLSALFAAAICALPGHAVAQSLDAMKAPTSLQLPHDLSPFAMFIAADWVVKSVMICLAAASLATWTILVAKTVQLTVARRRTRASLMIILHSQSLDEAVKHSGKRHDPAARMLQAARDETDMSTQALREGGGEGLKERVSSVLSRIEIHGSARLMQGTGLLATIGSVAPFVGLFGTVWGIMNAFIGISKAQTTNLAVVAPGIAEALLATAIGLVAAIPAVVIYNFFARSIGSYREILGDAAAGVERLVSRDLDFRAAKQHGCPSLSQAAE